jgi:hypothetical protein
VKTGECFYVGKGKDNRAYSNHRSEYWCNFVNKHGEYKVEFIIKDIDEEFSFLIEQEVIDLYRRKNVKLVNITAGGEGFSGMPAWNKGLTLSENHRINLSNAHKGKSWSLSQRKSQDSKEIKEKHREAVKAAMSKPSTKEKHRLAVSVAKKGKPQSEAYKLATSIAIKAWWAERKQKGAYASIS